MSKIEQRLKKIATVSSYEDKTLIISRSKKCFSQILSNCTVMCNSIKKSIKSTKKSTTSLLFSNLLKFENTKSKETKINLDFSKQSSKKSHDTIVNDLKSLSSFSSKLNKVETLRQKSHNKLDSEKDNTTTVEFDTKNSFSLLNIKRTENTSLILSNSKESMFEKISENESSAYLSSITSK